MENDDGSFITIVMVAMLMMGPIGSNVIIDNGSWEQQLVNVDKGNL